MTVKEMIEHLNKIDQDAMVVVKIDEGGYEETSEAIELRLKFDPYAHTYAGSYKEQGDGPLKAVLIE